MFNLHLICKTMNYDFDTIIDRYGEPWLEACKKYIEQNVLYVAN